MSDRTTLTAEAEVPVRVRVECDERGHGTLEVRMVVAEGENLTVTVGPCEDCIKQARTDVLMEAKDD